MLRVGLLVLVGSLFAAVAIAIAVSFHDFSSVVSRSSFDGSGFTAIATNPDFQGNVLEANATKSGSDFFLIKVII
jgi:hypothetical protein